MSDQKHKLSTAGYRGTRDFYPPDMQIRNWIFGTMRRVATTFGYQEYDGPMLEMFDLYAAKSGEELVNEQLYHFTDRGGRHVAIRPEMTPTVARMVSAKMNELVFPVRWFALPNLWRYEKPQRGRLREHWQFNVDIFGVDSVSADHEILEIAVEILLGLGAEPGDFLIHLSNRKLLNHFLNDILGLDTKGRLTASRAIDKKTKIPPEAFRAMLLEGGFDSDRITSLESFMSLDMQALRAHPVFDSDGGRELNELFLLLEHTGIIRHCKLDLSIVRGLEYYTGTVFEMYDQAPENKRALFGGGRYDDLTGLFSSNRVSGIGFGMGDVTIQDFVETHQLIPEFRPPIEIMIALFDPTGLSDSLQLAARLRHNGFRTATQLEPSKLGKQFKLADQMKIPVVLIQGPDEREKNLISLKHLPTSTQVQVHLDSLEMELRNYLAAL